MKSTEKGPLAAIIEQYLTHKRSLGKSLNKVGSMLRLLDGYLLVQGIENERQITSAHLEGFIASRSRRSARSYNGLIGAIRGLLDWMVVHELLLESPLRCESHRITPPARPFLFTPDQARHLLEVAQQLPSSPRAQNRGEVCRMMFGLLYALGLRVGEVSRLCRKDIDFDRQLLIIRQTKFGKDRLVPFGPRVGHVIRGWLGHVSLETRNRYAEITLRTKQAALEKCGAPEVAGERIPRKPIWQTDTALLAWLQSL